MSDDKIRMTVPTLKILRFLLEAPLQGRSGAEISKATGVGSGTLYPTVFRLEGAGWLRSEWEQIDPHAAGRPPRRYYWLTALGQNNANRVLADFQLPAGEPSWAR
jgi:PadR family transcriptional regulator, regulatory protein PadR